MRVLAVDAGNSRIKWGAHDGDGWLAQGWVETARPARLDGAWRKLPRPEFVVASNVADPSARRAITAAPRRLDRSVRFVWSRARQWGIASSYNRPAQLGADRWAALIGAWHLFHGPCVVVNAGTTMTVYALDGEDVLLGGTIVPGVDLMRHMLTRRTAELGPRPGQYAFFPARTADAIMSGALNALSGAIERMHRFMREAGIPAPLVVVSGGTADR